MPLCFQVDLDGRWHDYASHLDGILKQALVEGQGWVNFQDRGQPYRCDIKKLTQTNKTTGKVRKMRAPCVQVNIDGCWQDYADGEGAKLRQAYLRGDSELKLRCRTHQYSYDFERLVQTNLKTGTVRKMRVPPGLRVRHSAKSGVTRNIRAPLRLKAAPAPVAVASPKLKIVQTGKTEKKISKKADGSSMLVESGKMGRQVLDARTGKFLKAEKITRKKTLEFKGGKTIETHTIVVKRVRKS
eukprot:TRINITY_DN91374_c0_g1_i1.p1 TRINITY_DN91374_c0_g1~~TRINITY_DN91374_c0_g1_i1.p1  ORF type:complete len:242 (+),score=37.49 TRINITY_DN91374_c0_g1_i1:61-786(+)